MKEITWFDDDDLQEWQRLLFEREFKNDKYEQSRDESIHTDCDGTVAEDLPE